MEFTPKQIVTQLLNTEYELQQFTRDFGLQMSDCIVAWVMNNCIEGLSYKLTDLFDLWHNATTN